MAKGRGRGRAGAPAHTSGGRGRGRGKTPTTTGGGNSVKTFLRPHTGKQAGAVANAEAGTEFNAPIREGREQAAGSKKREADLGDWYSQLADDYQGAEDAGSAALKSVEDSTSANLAASGQRSTDEQASLAAGDESFAKLVGGPKDTAGLARIAQAAQAAGSARADQAKPTLTEAASYVGRVGEGKAAARLQGIEAKKSERERRDKLLKDVTAVRKEKGQARVANKDKIRESDRSYTSELAKLKLAKKEARTAAQAAAASAALAQVEASRKAEQDAITNRQAAERIGISEKSTAISAKNAKTSRISALATKKHYSKESKGGLTTAERRAQGEHAQDAMSAAKALLAVKVPKTPQQWAQFQEALIEKVGSSYAAEAGSAVARLKAAQKSKATEHNRALHQGRIPGH